MDKVFGIAQFTVRPGQEAAFRERAAECLAAARADLTGTGAYEWFLTPDGKQCTVLEIYDGLAGMATHIQQVGRIMPKLLEHVSSEVTLLGEVDEAMLARVTGKLHARFGGRRFLGRLDGPAAVDGSVGPEGIVAIAHFRLHPGVGPAFRERVAPAFATVVAKEPGTMVYEWFMNQDETEAFALDVYRDQAALLAHSAHAGTAMRDLRGMAEATIRLFGGVDEQTRAAYAARPGLRYVAPRLQGIL